MKDTDRIYSQHTSKQYNEELSKLRADFLEMGELVERQIKDALDSLLTQNKQLAEEVLELDHKTNDYERQIDQDCTQIIALRQPAAIDLRLIISITRALVDLERIGDEATRVARQTLDLVNSDNGTKGLQEIRHIGELIKAMFNKVLKAFADSDTEAAYEVVKCDLKVDQEYQSAMRSLITFMMEDSRAISNVLKTIWVLRSLERIGDHACNLAEHVIYQVSGADVRHMDTGQIKEIVRD
ncbi:MAG TPA: phosphate signaling complex protein PhoU [Marinobacterium sp.]|nr:phosphate signaling complex protein PhoU [Marinobacterium sp.]